MAGVENWRGMEINIDKNIKKSLTHGDVVHLWVVCLIIVLIYCILPNSDGHTDRRTELRRAIRACGKDLINVVHSQNNSGKVGGVLGKK